MDVELAREGMRSFHGVGVLLLVVVAVLVPGVAQSAGTISGRVTHDGAAVAGAVVTVAAPDQPPKTVTTSADGRYSVDVGGNGPYSVGVQAAGMAAHSAGNVQPGTPHDVALDSASFTPLPVNSGASMALAADATSGVFYAAMQGAPELYRTLDHGGNWQPVAMRYEDPDTGLNRTSDHGESVATSAVPGEVAVVTNGRIPGPSGGFLAGGLVHFSTDYGITWRTIRGLLPPHAKKPFLFWGHAGPASHNVVVVAQPDANGNWSAWRANMSVAEPAFVQEPSDPFGQGSAIAAAHSADGSFLGRVTASGELSFARLTSAGAIAFGSPEAAGLPTPPVMLRLGGAKEGAAPPDGALIVGGTGPPYTAQMLTKSSGAASFAGGSPSAPTAVPSTCRFLEVLPDVPVGSVAPTAAGDSGSGSIGACWVNKSGNSSLTISPMSPEARDVAYDANWGATNHVMIQGGSSGLRKFARLRGDGVPDLGGPSIASPGTDPGSGGLSIRGLVSPAVTDTAYGPGGAHQLAVSIFFGQQTLASRDGGQSFAPVAALGSGARQVRWWQGASGQWLLFGHGQGPGKQLSAALNWDGASIGPPNVEGSRPEDLGAPGHVLTSLHEVPGTDSVFVGLSQPNVGGGRLYRARIVPGSPPSLADVFSFDPALGAIPLYGFQAYAYCPSSSADPRMRDVLFVASGETGALGSVGESKGSLLRITGATTGTPAVSEVSSVPHGTPRTAVADVRAHCARGVVYAGGATGILYKSTDGGATFSSILLTGPGGAPLTALGMAISAIGLNAADPNGNDVKVAAGLGMITHSTDGGANWTIINDPETRRPVTVSDIEFPPAGGSTNSVAPSATAPRPGLLGTSGGAFRAELAVTRGVLGVTAAAGGTRRTQTQITGLGSDSHPAAVVAQASGESSAVFRRSNGLYFTSTSSGSWALPTEIPGTARGDFPAVALDPAGGVNVVFARIGAAPGIYATRRDANGVWAVPRRLSSSPGDTLPAISMPATGTGHVAFLRTRGRARGIFYASSRGGRWSAARRVRGTGAADASPALGGPTLDAFAGRVHLAFARPRRMQGIYYTARRGSRWSAPRRLTRSRDTQPALAVTLRGGRYIVFRRAGGKRRGLFTLRGAKRWSLARIPGTTARDGEPALSLSTSGSALILAFARPSGPVPGVYYDARGLNGRWLPKPRRWSTSAKDRNPSVHADFRGRLTVVFDRG